MQTVTNTTTAKAAFLKITPNKLREIANNMEKEAQTAESQDLVVAPITDSLTFIYYPEKKLDTKTYGSNREEPAFVPQNKSPITT